MVRLRVAKAEGDNRNTHILHQFQEDQVAAQRGRKDQAVKADGTQAFDDHGIVEHAFDV